MRYGPCGPGTGQAPRRSAAARDMIAIGVALLLLLLFLTLQRSFAGTIGDRLHAFGADHSSVIVGLLLLNIALTIYGWRRYRDAAHELAERTAAEERAQSLASTDPLTGFLNRRALAPATAHLFDEARRTGSRVAMFVIDLDAFKTVNDVHGHLTGDNLLRTAATAIKTTLPLGAVTARLGGDEFAAAFRFDAGERAEVDRIAAALVARLGRPLDLAGVHVHISASIGIARSAADCASVEALTRRADIAMYAAKKMGRGRHAWFDTSMERELEARNATEAGLRRGIPAGEFLPYFEQQIDLETGRLHGFEMLARWNHPERGIVAPDSFIGVAEECGLIGDLSLSVMRQAFLAAREWDRTLMLSVNISPLQLKDPWLAHKITKLLVETGFPSERLEVEITESSLFENLGLAQAIISSLKNRRIRLALDDFGTGYSSLAHLRALPFDRIKIDRSFVSSLATSDDSVAIVTAITRLAESLGLAITAEGIETHEIAERLAAISRRYKGQGYLFGRPVSITEADVLAAAGTVQPAANQAQRG